MTPRFSPLVLGAACAAALAVAGCASLPEPPAPTMLYDFGHAAQPAQEQAPAERAGKVASIVLPSVAASGLPTDSQVMLYRLAYADDLQLRGYQNARWSQSVQRLFEQQLRQQLERSHVVLDQAYSPVRLSDGDATPPVLHADIERFEQVFSSTSASEAIVRVRVTVVHTTGVADRVLGQRVFERSTPANSADAAGGAQALASTARQVAADIDAWLGSLP